MNIIVTESAKTEILRQNVMDAGVRIFVSSMGWGGPTFSLSLEEATKEDLIVEVEGIRFLIDEMMQHNFKILKVDFGNMRFQKGFIITQEDGFAGGCS